MTTEFKKGVDHNTAGLDIYIGCMYAAKSTTLLARLFTATEVGLKALYINNQIDERNKDDIFSSHNPQLKTKLSEGKVDMIKTKKLEDIDLSLIKNYDIIGVDEAHFFPNLDSIIHWVDILEKRVIVASLDGDYKRETFGQTLKLIPIADSVTKLHAYCVLCSKEKILRPALFTHRFAKTGQQIEVGAHDKYSSLCRSCYLIENQQQSD